MSREAWRYYRDALGERPLPAALVDLDNLERNLSAILERAGDLPVRIASKSVRSIEVLRHAQAFDPRFRGLMCFHAREACMLAERGFDDLLVAYPTVEADAVRQVCRAIRQGSDITLMVDCPEHVRRLAAVAAEEGVTLPLCLDVDMSMRLPGLNFGVFRSPVRSADDALAVYHVIREHEAVNLAGVMGYEAQIAGVTDTGPGQVAKNAVIRALKKRSIRQLTERRDAVVRALHDAGARLRFVNGGGTGSLETTAADNEVTEVTAGSGLYAPALFDHYHNFRHVPAAMFALEVVRQPDDDHVTCLGGGYVASGSASPDRLPVPALPEGLALDPNEGAGEVQTPLTGDNAPALGEPVFFRHAKAGELCERFNELLLIRDGRVERTVPTYRGEGLQFL
jgi:D-serine deaminase-like pyridoxal phosphate-dependent protein